MIFTKELFEQGKSSNNGWNNNQLAALGITTPFKGWARTVIGKDLPEESINLFLSLKNTHFRHLERIKMRKDQFDFVETPDVPWKDQYKHPNWQKMRLIILKRDMFKCVNCGRNDKMLHVHHLKYGKNMKIWEVPKWYLVSLCEDCHSEEHNRDLRSK